MHRVIKVHKVTKDNQELTLVKVLRVILEHKVTRDNQELMLVKVHKVLLEHKVTKGIRVTKVDYQHLQFLQVVLSYGLVQQMLFHLVGYYVMVQITHQT